MEKVNATRYGEMIRIHYDLKMPFFAYGAPGIGKSAIPLQVFYNMALERAELGVQNKAQWDAMSIDEKLTAIKTCDRDVFKPDADIRQFVAWNSLSFNEKIHAIENPERYFVFVDFRLTQCDPADLKGVPKLISEHDMLEYSPLSWVRYFENPTADGAIFFDELNLATAMVAASAYQIINEGVVADIKLTDNLFIFGAGNRSQDKAYVNPLPNPLRDRFNEFELEVNADIWLEWAIENDISHHIITFITWKKSWIYNDDIEGQNKATTPRGLVRASKLLKRQDDILSENAHQILSIAVGAGCVTEFQAYIANIKDLNIQQYFDNPTAIHRIANDGDKMFALCGVIVDHMPDELNESPEWDVVFDLIDEVDKEHQIIILNNMRSRYSGNDNYTLSILKKNNRMYKLVQSLMKFIT